MKHTPELRISLVCNTAWAMYTYRQGLIRMFVAQGVAVTVLAPYDETVDWLRHMGCNYINVPIASQGTNPYTDLHTLWALYRHYRATQPHLVFHYTIKPNIYGSIAAWLARVPSIAVTTGLGYVFIRHHRVARIAKKLYRIALRFPREIWFLNKDDQATFVAEKLLVYPERAQQLAGEGVDLKYFAYTPLPHAPHAPHFNFLLLGRLLWDKGIGEYVEAARRLRTQFPHARFQLLGSASADNPSAIPLKEVLAWQHEGLIDYLGQARDVRPHIANAHCIVLPSYREGLPRALLEAAAMGRPIVATDVPGCRDVVDNGITGLLCKARNAISLTSALQHMLTLAPEARCLMGQAGCAKIAQKFDEAQVIKRYQQAVRQWTGTSL